MADIPQEFNQSGRNLADYSANTEAANDFIRPKESSPDTAQDEAKEKAQVKLWLDRVEHSEQYRKKAAEFYRWRQLVEEYRGRYYALQQSTDIYVPMVNLIYAFIKSEIPALYLNNPKIKVNPKKGSTVVGAKILEKALNYIWRTKRIKRENKKNVFDNMVVGHSWFKTGYTGKFGAIEENNDTWEFISEEDFFGYRIPFDAITFNPDSNDPPFDTAWIAHQVWVPLEELKQDTRFKHTEDLSAAQKERDNFGLYEIDDKLRYDPDLPMACLYEVWDKRTHKRFVISKECDYYLLAPSDWPYQMKGFPFSFLRINDDPRNPYGIPDCFMFEQHVIELMKLLAQKLDHVKRFNRQMIGRRGALDDNEKSKYQNAVTGAYLEADIASNEPINNIMMAVPYPPVQPDLYNVETTLKDYLVLISGKPYSEFGGKQDTTTRTIRELQEMQKGATDRRAEKIDSIENFIEDISLNIISLLQQFVDIPFYVKVTDEDPQTILEALRMRPSISNPQAVTNKNGFTFTKDDILGEFDVEVVAGSTVPMDQQKKVQLLMQILQLMPQLQPIHGGPVMQTLTSELADELDLPEFVQALKQEMQLMQQQQAAAQEQAKKAQEMEIAKTSAKTQLSAEREATRQNQLLVDFINSGKEDNNNG